MVAKFRLLAVTAGVLATVLAGDNCLTFAQRPQQPPAGRATKDPILVRQTEFGIPFKVDAPNQTPQVQLMVSNDRGANWIGYQRQSSQQDRFVFQARNDGEYWFAIRTFDASGRPTDSSAFFQPELKVAVDTQTPVVTLDVQALETGEVIAKWVIKDPAIDPQNIHLSYQTSAASPYQQVQVDASKAYQANGVIAGETRWFPLATERVMLVRLEAYDKAGNVGAAQQSLSVPLVAQRPNWNGVPRQVPGTSGGEPNSLSGGNVPVDPFQQRRIEMPQPPKQAVPWPTDNAIPQPQNQATTPQASPQSPPPSTFAQPSPQPMGSGLDSPFRPANMKMEPPVANSSDPNVRPQPSAKHVGLPPGVEPQSINTKGFALNYGVETVGPSGIGQIELWVTRDAGETWEPGGIDPDRESPFDVEVQSEGIYGFRIVVEGGNGLTGRRPQPGDLADIWVNVDLSKPVTTITNVIYGEGPNVGHLDISWTATDAFLAERSVSLYYASSADGPWKPIAENIANTGKFIWKITPEVPADIYLKITATDQAGNLGEYVLKRAIANDGLVPRGQIRSLRPLKPLHDQAGMPVSVR
ncbi:hypothetical protein [Blastopirellula marina]|uniref:Ser-Thr-rich glycosyl-phosphatidyl-inositol-anchored membrane family protein n=1 Tax=Blastopirellula marina TaxID=124 RepID=A0A2S8FCX1_9BACT|nr:hypothetical protein [Blastopirellula marina]PQO30006.1 hypothetical protein C5Y98_22365 [Blastopirellula marina]PTL42475.1 hypothetical protein C5Y97_22375 [Blastopirellula marina]